MTTKICKAFFIIASLTFANANELLCEKLKDKDLVQNYLLTELFSNLSEYQQDYFESVKLGINIYTKQISADEDTTICAFYSKLRFSDTQLSNEEIKSIKESFAKRGDFATYEENEKTILHYAKLLKYNNKPLEDIPELLERAHKFNDIYKYDGLLQIHTFKMGYLQKDENAGGYFAPEEAINDGKKFLNSKDSQTIKDWIKTIDSMK